MQDAGLQGRWRGGGKGQRGFGEVVVVCGEMFVASPPGPGVGTEVRALNLLSR